MKKINTFTLVCVAIILIVSSCKQKETTIDFQLSVPVSVMVLKTSSIEEYINATGTVSPVHDAVLTSRVEGQYFLQKNPKTGKPYALGDMVDKGDVIIRFEDDEYKNQVKIESVKLNMDISKMEYDKQQSLYEKGGVTLRELKNGEIAYVNAKIDYENAKLNLAKMNVIAPFKGMITDISYFTRGTRVSSGTEVLKLMYYRKMLMDINLPEKNYVQVKKGQEVIVTNYSLPDDTLRGIIDQISPSIDPDARTFKCVVSIDNPSYKLLPGMFVKADLIINKEENAIVIPKKIIKSRGGSNSVFIVDNGAARERRIRTGISNGEDVMVTQGLEPGDRIVIKGFETLRNRSKIKILNEEVQKVEAEEGDKENKEGAKKPEPGSEGAQGKRRSE